MNFKDCPVNEFVKELRGRKVICFGAGGTLIEPEVNTDIKKIIDLEKHIAFLVDNDTNKQGLSFHYRDKEFEIKSPAVLEEVNAADYVLLITCEYFVEIYHQLKDVKNLENMDCYLHKTVCRAGTVNLNQFFTKEIQKAPYKEWRRILADLHLKDKHKGQRCFFIGNGPSLKSEDLERIKNEYSFGVNGIYNIFGKTNWRPTYYITIDTVAYPAIHEIVGSLDAKIRFVPYQNAVLAGKVYDEVTYFNQELGDTHVENNQIVENKPLTFSQDIEKGLCCRHTVLYTAFQLAVYMGFSEIYLLGVDHSYSGGILEDGTKIEHSGNNHFYESLTPTIDEEAPFYLDAMTYAYKRAKEICENKGIIVKNATRGGRLEIFERVDFEKLVQEEENEDINGCL